MTSTPKRAKSTAGDEDASEGFTQEERAAIKERAREVRAGKRSSKVDNETAVLQAIAEMGDADRVLAERLHAVITTSAPGLAPKLWYGMPAYAKDGKVLCFFQNATKFKTRYATLGFNDLALLDDGTMWPTAYALTTLTAADEAVISDLVKRAVG